MKNKTTLLFVLGLMVIGPLINSCKKDNQGSIESLLSTSMWQLASVTQTTYLGGAILLNENLNTTCTLDQVFSFKADNTCTYTNFECIQQDTAGKWSLSPDKLTLYVDMTCRDTTAVGSSQPLDTARIINLGQNSLVVETGPLSNFSTTVPRKIRRYGFIRLKTLN